MAQNLVKDKRSPYDQTKAGPLSTVTVGAEAANVINVGVQLKNSRGKNVAVRMVLNAWLSDAATGAGLVAAAPSGGVAIGTNGIVLNAPVANKLFKIVTDATGRFDINVTEAGAKTEYLVIELPDGTLLVSGAITHT